MFGRDVLRDILRDIGGKQPWRFQARNCAASPVLTASALKAGGIFLRDARKNAFAAGAFNSRPNAGKFLLESLPDLFRKLEIGRRVPGDLAFLCCGRNQRRRDGLRRRHCRTQRRGVDKRHSGGAI